MSARKNLRDTLLDGLEQLIRDGSNKNFWFSTRAIADAVIALNFCLPSTEFNKLKRGSLQYMLNEGERSTGNSLNWNEEVWDTSVAAMALAVDPVRHSEEISKASAWIKSKYLTTHTSWNEEIWETLFALNAISYLHRTVPSTYDPQFEFTGSIEWLIKIVNNPREGLLINWSSTALLVILAHSHELPGMKPELKQKLIGAAEKCAKAIAEAPILDDEEILWTPEAWSNGLVLWALAVARPGILSSEKNFKIAKWFKERVSAKALPTEDRAFSCIGLYHYLEYLETAALDKVTSGETTSDEIAVQYEELKNKVQERIAATLKQRVSDYQSSPPLFSRQAFTGYYSINIKSIFVNVVLIVGTTGLLSYLTLQAQNEDSKSKLLVLVPIVLGALATIAQLANFSLWPKSNRNKNDKSQQSEDDE